MSMLSLSTLSPGVLEDLLKGIQAPSSFVFHAGMPLYRLSSSPLFAKGFFVSPWWFTKPDFEVIFDSVRKDQESLSDRARGMATIPSCWHGQNWVNFLDLAVTVELRESAAAFRGPGQDQIIAVYGKVKKDKDKPIERDGDGNPKKTGFPKVKRAPRDAMQNFLPVLSSKNVPPPSLVDARKLFLRMSVCPIDRFVF